MMLQRLHPAIIHAYENGFRRGQRQERTLIECQAMGQIAMQRATIYILKQQKRQLERDQK